MRQVNLLLFLTVFIFQIGSVAASNDVVEKPVKTDIKRLPIHNCEAKTVAHINVNVSKTAGTFKELSQYFEDLKDDIDSKAKRMGLSDFELKSSNFNINSYNNRYQQNSNSSYNLNGSLRYESTMTDKAITLAESLTDEDYKITYSENMNRGYCPRR